jgi:hypothetical protein
MLKVSPASLQTFIDTPNCVLEDRVQYSTVHIPNVFCDGHLQIMNCVGKTPYHNTCHSCLTPWLSLTVGSLPPGPGDTRITLKQTVIPDSNYVIIVSD